MGNDKITQQSVQQEANCRTEYSVVAEGWKFFANLRFIVAAFAVMLQSVLVTLYNQAIKDAGGKGQMATVIAFAGLYTIVAISLIERRTIRFLVETMQRGTELEFRLGTTEGFFCRLLAPKLFRPRGLQKIATHTGGLVLVYASIGVLWIYFFVTNLITWLA